MDVAAWHDALERDTAALADAAERAPLDTPVRTCPGWSLADLVHHCGVVLNFWTALVRDEIDDPEMIDMPARPDDTDLGVESSLHASTFVDRAPADVVAKERESLDELRQQLANVTQALARLKVKE